MNTFNRIISIGIGLVMCVSMVAALHANSSDIIPAQNGNYRNAIIKARKWPNGVIPYVFEETTSQEIKIEFLKFMDFLAEETDNCLRFVPRTNEKSYLIINHTLVNGCWSSFGMQPEPQTLYLGQGCEYRGTLLHETLHAAGFHHEQCRPDRDDYIEILAENVLDNLLNQFDKLKSTTVTTLDLPYDYYSIMHYDVYSFTKDPNGELETMRVKDPNVEGDLVGNSQDLTLLDILKVKKFYGCIPDTTNTLKIAIKEKKSDKFISANDESLIADSACSATPSQQFEISFNADSTVCLKSLANQKYLSVDDNGVLMANSDDCESDSARIYLASPDDGVYVLKSKNNLKYIEMNEDLVLIANGDFRSNAATFIISRL